MDFLKDGGMVSTETAGLDITEVLGEESVGKLAVDCAEPDSAELFFLTACACPTESVIGLFKDSFTVCAEGFAVHV